MPLKDLDNGPLNSGHSHHHPKSTHRFSMRALSLETVPLCWLCVEIQSICRGQRWPMVQAGFNTLVSLDSSVKLAGLADVSAG